jgi:hypothetical protein
VHLHFCISDAATLYVFEMHPYVVQPCLLGAYTFQLILSLLLGLIFLAAAKPTTHFMISFLEVFCYSLRATPARAPI